jgi:uncharacterized damage-inducible protein DinB
MSISDVLFPEFDQEITNTRNLLQRVPLNKADWRPHKKSMSMGHLSGHIAHLPSMIETIVIAEMLDLTPKPGVQYQPDIPKLTEDLLAAFDKSVSTARDALAGASEQHLNEEWSIQIHGKPVASGAKSLMVRMVINHLIHHRAQLGVYLRLNDIPLPAMYGPSADESPL